MDCKVPIRRYVLIARPSKWAQKGDPVVVQSPVLNITHESAIPVRRFNGDDKNSVCLMPTQDIERDGSNAYKRAMITSKATLTDSHGVAICKSEDSDFEYRPGDQFWLSIAAKTDGYETDVPVINLRTMAMGSIPISHVCWFPKMQGPGNEVWTFGGKIRKQKHHPGRDNYTFWSWGICQYLNGEPATTKNFQIPKKNTSTNKQRWLPPSDARPLFSQIHKNMTKNHQFLSPLLPPPQSSSAKRCKLPYTVLYTPPASPYTNNSSLLHGNRSPLPRMISKAPDMATLKYIKDSASKGRLRSLHSSIIYSQRIPSSPDRKKYRRTSVDSRSDSGFSDKTAMLSTRSPSLTIDHGDFSPRDDLLMKIYQDGGGAGVLCLTNKAREVAKQLEIEQPRDTERPVLSAAHPALRTNPTILSERHRIMKNMPTNEFIKSENEHIAGLCDRGKVDCEWSLRYTSKHYHPDDRKCTIVPQHEHCISAERAFPRIAGPCLLIGGSRVHECCVWKDEDMKDWPAPIKKKFDDCKIVEARKYHMAGYEQSFQSSDKLKDESKKIKEEMWLPVVGREAYDKYGEWFTDDLSKGNSFDEVSKLGGGGGGGGEGGSAAS